MTGEPKAAFSVEALSDLVSLNWRVLQAVDGAYARHDAVVQRLERRIASDLEQQASFRQQLQVGIERSFLDIQRALERLGQERDAMLTTLCYVHSQLLALAERPRSDSGELTAMAGALAQVLQQALEGYGVQCVYRMSGLPFDVATMEIVQHDYRSDVPVGIVLHEVVPGYRHRDGRCLSRARVVVNVAQTDL